MAVRACGHCIAHAVYMQLMCNDTSSAMQLFDDCAYGDLEQGSIYERSEANLLKVGAAVSRQSSCGVCSFSWRAMWAWGAALLNASCGMSVVAR